MKRKIYATMMAFTVAIVSGSLSAVVPVMAVSEKVTTNPGFINLGRGSVSITIQGDYASKKLIGKKFNLYQLFDAKNSVGGESIHYTFRPECKTALQNVVGKALGKAGAAVTEYEVIDYIQSLNNNQVEGANTPQKQEGNYSQFRYFIERLRDELERLGSHAADVIEVTGVQSDGSVIIRGLEYGYYILDEITDNQGDHSASSLCMVNTANPDTVMKVKSDFPSIVKKIQEDDNPDLIGNNGWNDMADFEIGQTVPYKYTSKVPNINGYETYYFAFHDRMDQALTFHKNSVQITISDAAKEYTLKNTEFSIVENLDAQTTFKIAIDDLKKIVDREFNKIDTLGHNTYGQNITVTYDATLNDQAANDTGRPGFENDVRLEFSNDSDSAGAGKTGFTPWDTVVCFTYKLDVLKTNDHNMPLKDAKFRLYSEEGCSNEVYVKKTSQGYNVINRDRIGGADHVGGTAPSEAVEMSSDEKGNVVIYGLDDGVYYLKETKAPDGYRVIQDPMKLTVDASFVTDRNNYVKGDGATDQALTDLKYQVAMKQFLNGSYSNESKELKINVEEGSGNMVVVNHPGSKLPVTGSSVTILMLVAGSGMILIGKKLGRKKDEE